MKSKGFTLIELLVSIMVISLLIGTIIGLFVSVIKNQRRILTYQEILSQTSYALEKTGRALRMAEKDLGPNCLTVRGLNYEIIGGGDEGTGLRFINHLDNNDCQEFFLESGQLKYQKDAANALPPPALFLTSDNFLISDLKFKLSGQGQEDFIQPRVTFVFTLQAASNEPKIKVQTTISQRNLDIKY